jgi:hypothetical protein
MIRYAIFIAAVVASTASAIASIAPTAPTALDPARTTIIEKNQAFPQFGDLIIDECAVEDCSEE